MSLRLKSLAVAFIAIMMSVAASASFATDDIAVTQDPAIINMCETSGRSVLVHLTATVLTNPTPDYECGLNDEPTYSWTGGAIYTGDIGDNTARVAVIDTPLPPNGTVTATFTQYPDGADYAWQCDGTVSAGPSPWSISGVSYTGISATLTGGQKDYSTAYWSQGLPFVLPGWESCPMVEYHIAVVANSAITSVQWSTTGAGSITDDGNAGAIYSAQFDPSGPAGPGVVQCIITTANGCTKTVKKNYVVHKPLEFTRNPDVTWWSPWNHVAGDDSVWTGNPAAAWNWTASVNATVGFTPVVVFGGQTALAAQLGVTVQVSAGVSLGQNVPIPVPAVVNDNYGLYYAIEYTTQSGTLTSWNCDGTSTFGIWQNDTWIDATDVVADLKTGPAKTLPNQQ